MSRASLHETEVATGSDSFRQPDIVDRESSGLGSLVWHAVLTRYRHERKVCDQLTGKQIEVFFPTTFRWSVHGRHRKRVEWPLFPGYCFVRIPSHLLIPVLSCAGVAHIVSFAGKPAPIPDYEIEAIQRLITTSLAYDALPFVKEGAPVRVIRGPLAGTRGRLVRKGLNYRLLLAIELLGRVLSVEVDASDVEPA
ncbi:MAG: UpxY family transcription antiterminator [Acidobacteria bacterium]|nr:UpxY family transcription antiterminator [Acidobacteriota bacterium]